MTTPAKLYGKDLNEYDDVDVDTLLAQLSPEEINILAKEVDPDVSKSLWQNLTYFWILKFQRIFKIQIFNVVKFKMLINFNILSGFISATMSTYQLRVYKVTNRSIRS